MSVLRKFYYVTNIFDVHIFDKEMAVHSNFFQIYTEMIFFSLFFLNERNIATPLTPLFKIHSKRTAVHYAYLNSSSINKPLNMLFRLRRFLVYVYFNKPFVKKVLV